MLCGDAESRREPPLVKADYHFISDENNRYAHLSRFLYHFLALLEIMRDVVFSVGDALFFEKIFGHLAEMAGRGAVDSNSFVHSCLVTRKVYHATRAVWVDNDLQNPYSVLL